MSPRLSREEHLAVPYILWLQSVETSAGQWARRASLPELPGCSVQASSAEEAVELLDIARQTWIIDAYERGAEIPVPRPPLYDTIASGLGVSDG
jgi:predicted RNase H-like HicB family nuclease